MASNKGWQGAIFIVRHTKSITLPSIKCTFGVMVIYQNGGESNHDE
ncbi:hypothetical protein [Bacillus cereus]